MKETLFNAAVKLFLTKSVAKALIRATNKRLQSICKLEGKEKYVGYTTDAMKELAVRAECLSDDGTISDEELERINAFDEELVDKYWKE